LRVPRVVPARPRSIQTTIPGGIRVVIPARRQWFQLVFLSGWFVGWCVGEATAFHAVVAGELPPMGRVFVAGWLLAWSAAGVLVSTTIAWGAAGREILSVAGGSLRIRREAFGIGRTWEYDAAEIRNVRVAASPWSPFQRGMSMGIWGLGGSIAFDYGARTCRIAEGVDEAEAAQLVVAIVGRVGPDSATSR
jgi:hypothetical protein